jgi:hypothetical protein
VEVGVDDRFDSQAVRVGVVEVLGDVAAGVDDHGPAGGLVADQVGRVGQAVEIVLCEVHDQISGFRRFR